MSKTQKAHYNRSWDWEAKVHRVAERLGVAVLEYNWDRFAGWVVFQDKAGQKRIMKQTVHNAAAGGEKLLNGVDCFCQVVLTMEDFARAQERAIEGIHWEQSVPLLAARPDLPDWAKRLGFAEMPADAEAVRARYRQLAKVAHPDAGGKPGEWEALTAAYQAGVQHFEGAK